MIRYKDYGIKANDVGGYVLGKLKVVKGENVFSTISYPSTLNRALKEIVQLEFAKSIEVDMNLKDAIKELDRIQTELIENLKITKGV